MQHGQTVLHFSLLLNNRWVINLMKYTTIYVSLKIFQAAKMKLTTANNFHDTFM